MFPDADNNWGLSHSERKAPSGQVKYFADEVIHFAGRGLGGKALALHFVSYADLAIRAWAVARH
jgi:hypothetical protein